MKNSNRSNSDSHMNSHKIHPCDIFGIISLDDINPKIRLKKMGQRKGARERVKRKAGWKNHSQARGDFKRPWVKKLYENSEYPDNYTSPNFLEEMRKNVYVEKVTFNECLIGSFRVTQRLCLSILFVIIFVYMYNEWLASEIVVFYSSTVTIFGYILYIILKKCYAKPKLKDCYILGEIKSDIKTVLAYLVLGYILSPILYTLTDTVSTDTIYAMTVVMMLIHLLFFDYGVSAAIVSKSLSINAAIFGSICLISRLSNPFDAFILLTVSVLIFVVSQLLIDIMIGNVLFIVVFILTLGSTIYSLLTISMNLTCFLILAVTFLNFLCPYLFVKWQKHKENIYGPWDEAVIHDPEDFIE